MPILKQIINIILSSPLQDKILVGIFLVSGIGFFLAGISKVYKAILGVILGFMTFLVFNLGMNFLNDDNVGLLSGIRDFIITFKKEGLYFCFTLIFLFPIIMPFNKAISISDTFSGKIFSRIKAFFYGLLFPIFLLAIILSILNNNLIFSIDPDFVKSINSVGIFGELFTYFSFSHIFKVLSKYSNVVSLIFGLIIFYKITFAGILDGIISSIYKKIKSEIKERSKTNKNKKKDKKKNDEEEKEDEKLEKDEE